MKNIFLIFLVILVDLKPSTTQEDGIAGRLALMDRHIRRLNLTDIHFSDPGGFAKIDTIMNGYQPEARKSLIERLQKKVNETAHEMVNSMPQNVSDWRRKAVDLPLPVYRNISRLLARRQG